MLEKPNSARVGLFFYPPISYSPFLSMYKTKRIPLTQGRFALVDADDYAWLSRWKWTFRPSDRGSRGYAVRNVHYYRSDGKRSSRPINMHREILGLSPRDPRLCDHINGNPLDNRRSNLRMCTQSQNLANTRRRRNARSRYRGATWHRQRRKWRARIKHRGREIHLGLYQTEREAVLAYNAKATELYGEFARLNDVK